MEGNSLRNDARRQNRVSILRYLRENGARPRIDIAGYIHMTKASVTSLTNEMIAEGELVERGELLTPDKAHQRGRRKIMIDINENYKLAFGVVLERDFLFVGLTNLKGQTLDRLQVSLRDCEYRRVLELVVENVGLLVKNNCIPTEKILGMGCCLSRSGEVHVEGSTPLDKLARLKRDLSHAISMPIVIASTIGAALLTQKLFSHDFSDNMMIIRYGSQIEAALTANGRIYRGFSNRAGGFTSMQQTPDGTSFELFAGQDGVNDGTNPELNEKLAADISLCRTVLDPERIFGFGSYFETEFALTHINLFLEGRHSQKLPVEPSVITDATIHLAACAAVVDRIFYCSQMSE